MPQIVHNWCDDTIDVNDRMLAVTSIIVIATQWSWFDTLTYQNIAIQTGIGIKPVISFARIVGSIKELKEQNADHIRR